jgi:hypothetical protein
MNTQTNKDKVLYLLQKCCNGRNNALTKKSLAHLAGITPREFEKIVHMLRKEDHPIISVTEAPAGYFLPTTEQEARQYLGHFVSRIRNIYQSLKGVERGIKKMFPGSQTTLDLSNDK